MKQTILIPFIILLTTLSGWTQNNKTTITYIEQYKAIAMKEMKRTGVPASITLAQAIVESNSGESNLAKLITITLALNANLIGLARKHTRMTILSKNVLELMMQQSNPLKTIPIF